MNFHRLVLPNGVRVLTIPMPSFESVTVLVMVGAGSRYETKKNSGISHFLEHMCFKGTKKRPDAISISSVIDGIGGECNAFTGKETTGYYIKCAATQVTTAMDVLSDMLQNSLFNQTEIDKESGVILEEINLYEDTPMRKIGDVYEQLLYGDTPMGWDIAGKKDIITSIRRSDFIEYMKSLYSADNLTVVVAGGVSVAETEKMVKKYFEKMPKFKTISRVPVVDGQKKAKVLIKKKVTEQVHIALGVRTVGVNHKDKYPLAVLSAVLGGGMSSRLFSEIR
ncbi:MAG: pitrilysin family protein, partial [Patescibacteria group bacterium]